MTDEEKTLQEQEKSKPIGKQPLGKKDMQVVEKTSEEELEEERLKLELESKLLKEKEKWDKLTPDEQF